LQIKKLDLGSMMVETVVNASEIREIASDHHGSLFAIKNRR
jgi:hypothetical protein